MATTSKLRIAELDFDTIKSNLKDYFRGQTEFTDYDFDGSGLSLLLDVLAYNTHYLSFYLNMVANEMFLDSATQRDSIVSLAKQLGYTPRSKTGASVQLDLSMEQNSSSQIPDFVKIPAYTQFSVTSLGKTYTFYTLEDKIIVWTGDALGSNRLFTANNILAKQGAKLVKEFTVTGNIDQRFILDNIDIDTTTISIRVKDNSASSSYDTYKKYDGLIVLDSTSLYYFITEAEDKSYEISFGDGIYGKEVTAGNVITVDYLTTDGIDANGLTGLSLSSESQDWGESTNGTTASVDVAVTTPSASTGGGDIEGLDSIKFLAPRSFQHQNRAVTADDYKAILNSEFSNIASLRVWGGEQEETRAYGKVFIAIKPLYGEQLTIEDKSVITTILNKYKVIGIETDIKDPDYIGLKVDSIVKYNPTLTTEKMGTIQYKAVQAIKSYNKNRLGRFDGVFRYSQLSGDIDDADKSIMSNSSKISLVKKSPEITNYAPIVKVNEKEQIAVDDKEKYKYDTTVTSESIDYDIPVNRFSDFYIKDSVVEDKARNLDRQLNTIVKKTLESSNFTILGHEKGSDGEKSPVWNLLLVKIVDVPIDDTTGNLKIVMASDVTKDVVMTGFNRYHQSPKMFSSIVGTITYDKGKLHSWIHFPIVSIPSGKNTIDFIGEIVSADVLPEILQIISIKDEYINVTLKTDFDK